MMKILEVEYFSMRYVGGESHGSPPAKGLCPAMGEIPSNTTTPYNGFSGASRATGRHSAPCLPRNPTGHIKITLCEYETPMTMK